jgi:hypothetical protein
VQDDSLQGLIPEEQISKALLFDLLASLDFVIIVFVSNFRNTRRTNNCERKLESKNH